MDRVTKNEEYIIKEMQKKLLIEVDKLKKCKDKQEKGEKANTLYHLSLILENYEALEPTLQKFFYDRRLQNKWKGEER